MSFAQPFADYVILSRIGAGAMGTVFKARHKKLNRIVALKVLRPSLGRDTLYVERLRREARIVASLNHPNIVAGYDLGEEGGYHFFVMEYFEGPSLRTLLGEWGMFPEEQVLDLAIQVVKALDHAYRRGVIHRDIKPGNILINADGKVKLTDMGLAKGPADMALTRDGATVGTPQYISPEQARDPQGVDIRSDLYSLGATLYHMATGQTPFGGDTLAEIITKLLHERAASATDLNPKLSDGLSLVIRKLMAKDPELRYQTPRELLDDLLRVQRAEIPDVDLSSLEAAEPRERSPRRWRRIALAAALPAVIAVSIWIGMVASRGGDDPLSPEEYARHLEAGLLAAETYPDQLDYLAQQAGSATPAQAAEIAAFRRSVLRQLEQDIHGFVDERGDVATLRAWIADPAHWRDPDAWARAVRDGLKQQFGFAEFPDGVLRSLDEARSSLDALLDEREKAFLAALDEFAAADLEPAYRERLQANDFRGAADSVNRAASQFFAAAGHPRREQLPDGLRERVATVLEAAREVIDAQQTAIAGALERSVAQSLETVEAELAGQDRLRNFRLLREQVEELAAGLRGRYPPADHFEVGRDPWPRIEERIDDVRGELMRAEQAWQSEHLDGLLSLTYQTLVQQGDFRRARQWLDSLDEVSGVVLNERLGRHQAVLVAGQVVAHTVLQTLAGASQPLIARRGVDPNRELTLEIEPGEDGGYRLRALTPGRAQVAGSMVELRFSDLLEQALAMAPELFDDLPNHELGIALCLFISGQFDEALEYLSEDDRRFFRGQIWPILERVFATRDRAMSGAAGRALEDLMNAWRQAEATGSVGVLRKAFDEFTRRYQSFAEENASVVGEIEGWLLHAEQRRDVAAQVRDASLVGAEVAVDDNLRATVTYAPAAFSAMQLPEGWSAAPPDLEFALADLPLPRAHELQLALPGLPLPEDRETVLAVHLKFPGERGSPRIWLLESNGVSVAFGLSAGNAVVPVVVPAGDNRDPDGLRDALQAPLAVAAGLREAPDGTVLSSIVPGAIHELAVRVRPEASGNRLHVEVSLDGRLIAEGRQRAGARGGAAIIPMQPLSVVQVQLSGDFRR